MFYQDVPYVDYVQQDPVVVKQNIELILSQNSQIDSFSTLIWGNKLLVAVLPHPLYSRTQRDALKQSIVGAINQEYGFEEILVSFDMDVLYEVNKLNKSSSAKDEEISNLFYSVKVRRL